MNKRSRVLQSAKFLRKKRRKNIIALSLSIFCILIVLTVMIYIVRSPFLQISSIEIKGTNILDMDKIKTKAYDGLQGDYLWIIPKSSSLFFPKNSIKKTISESYKQIEKLDISRSGITSIEINVVERTPVALVCEDFHEENSIDSNCYFVDKDGYVFDKSADFSDGSFIHYYIINDKKYDMIGSNFIDSDRFSELQRFIENVSKSGIVPVGILIGENGAYELYIKNRDKTETIVYFDDRVSFDKTSSNLVAFWNNPQINKKSSTSTAVFDYINLRFGNNIFYVVK